MSRVRVCGAEELEVGSVRRVEANGTAIALVRCHDGYHAVVDNCSHEDYPLSEGEVLVDECEIECLRHGSTFSLIDGEPQSLPATRPVAVVPVAVEGGDVFVELP
ncbi:MAG TPA: Rieske 2Fe-2S domain-containing protein [Acidimicrobiales bacterium]|nr:Rieske 2Fe-2S domain-containing protein [Acidimicrobiales bacterium]